MRVNLRTGSLLAAAAVARADLDGTWDVVANANNTAVCVLASVQVANSSLLSSSSSSSLVLNWSLAPGNLIQSYSTDGSGTSTVASRIFPFNVFTGLEYKTGSTIYVDLVPGSLRASFTSRSVLLTSQSSHSHVVEQHHLELVSPKCLQYTWIPKFESGHVLKAERGSGQALKWLLSLRGFRGEGCGSPARAPRDSLLREETSDASAMLSQVPPLGSTGTGPKVLNLNLTDHWLLHDVRAQANMAVIGLQGLANRQRPALYLTYPKDWVFSYTPQVRNFFAKSYDLEFEQAASPYLVLETLQESAPGGYIVWDPAVRESLLVAYTLAGIADALVVTDELLAEYHKVTGKTIRGPLIANFTGQFRGKTPVEIYDWAKSKYFDTGLTSRNYIMFIGGACSQDGELVMRPGMADFGVANRVFFNDLSTNPVDPEERGLASRMVGALRARNSTRLRTSDGKPLLIPPFQMGWHSYCKDYEHTYTNLASSHGATVHGLNTNPNLSFASKLELPPGYVFKNHHSVGGKLPQAPALVEHNGKLRNTTKARRDQVYVVLVQTDGIGLGAWTKPGRGTIPYAWEVTLPDLEIQPALLRMFYEQATPKDYFVAALGGPGYMYPKATLAKAGPEMLTSRLRTAKEMMQILDLDVMIIFDASAAVGPHTVTENCNLTPEVAQAYFDTMSHDGHVKGFLNGYAPTFTGAHGGKQAHNASLLSFDYYLDPGRTIADSIQDLEDLARVNSLRPYFLAVHVREFSTVGKVQKIIAGLSAQFEVVPYDKFFQAMNAEPTFRERFS